MRAKGQLGEDAAVKYLLKKGFKIAERNYRTPTGEVDIVAMDGETLVFIEVKARKGEQFGSPAQSVNIQKQKRIIKAALYYLTALSRRKKEANFNSPVRVII